MCGRTANILTGDQVLEQTGASGWISHSNSLLYRPSYNNSPAKFQTVLVKGDEKHIKDEADIPIKPDDLKLAAMRWGLISSFQKDLTKPTPFNAQAEKISSGAGFWKRLRDDHRCVVVVSGYYEWKTSENGHKQPFYIAPKNKETLLYLAGLYDVAPNISLEKSFSEKALKYWKSVAKTENLKLDFKAPVCSCTIVTSVPSTPELADIHSRQPVILHNKKEIDTWLKGDWRPELDQIVCPPSDSVDMSFLKCTAVSTYVNKLTNQGEQCLAPNDSKVSVAIEGNQSKISSHFASDGSDGNLKPEKVNIKVEADKTSSTGNIDISNKRKIKTEERALDTKRSK